MIKWSDKAFKFRELMLEIQSLTDESKITVMSGHISPGWLPIKTTFAMDIIVIAPDGADEDDAPHVEWSEIGDCGTAACAVGWCSLVLVPMGDSESLPEYLDRVFINQDNGGASSVALSYWLFHNTWSEIAPNPRDVVTRFDYMLENYERISKAYFGCTDHSWMFDLWQEIAHVDGRDGQVQTIDGGFASDGGCC